LLSSSKQAIGSKLTRNNQIILFICLSITPTVTTDADVEYAWELWTSVRTDGIIYKPDTIGREKNLNYEVMEDLLLHLSIFSRYCKKQSNYQFVPRHK